MPQTNASRPGSGLHKPDIARSGPGTDAALRSKAKRGLSAVSRSSAQNSHSRAGGNPGFLALCAPAPGGQPGLAHAVAVAAARRLPSVLAVGVRRVTRYVRCAHCARTDAANRPTMRAHARHPKGCALQRPRNRQPRLPTSCSTGRVCIPTGSTPPPVPGRVSGIRPTELKAEWLTPGSGREPGGDGVGRVPGGLCPATDV